MIDTPSESGYGNLGRATADGMDAPPLLRTDDEVPIDRVFEILKNERRRRVLTTLDRADGPVELGVLAETIAAFENGTTPERVDSTQRKRVYVALYQCHLPKMADLGVIEYDSRAGRVELTEDAQFVLSMARRPSGRDRPWHLYSAGLGTGTTALFIANYLDLLPVNVAANVFVGFVITALMALSLAQGLVVRRDAHSS
jgi:hypothetical protein